MGSYGRLRTSKACLGLRGEADMTELKWNEWEDLSKVLRSLRGKVSDRKFRLFAVACLRRVGGWASPYVYREPYWLSGWLAEHSSELEGPEIAVSASRIAMDNAAQRGLEGVNLE